MSRSQQNVPADVLHLRLYISGNSEDELRVKINLESLLKKYLNDAFKLEVIDIVQDPRRALTDEVIVTPTLVKVSPRPEIKVIGDLADDERIRAALGLKYKEK
jgi:circadian clock protein KaiB